MARTNSGLLTRIAAPFCKFTLSLCAALGIVSAADAADYDWTGGGTDTNYSTPENWGLESGYPGSADGARFLVGAASKTVTFDGAYTPSYVWTATGNTASPVTWAGSGSVTTTWNIGCADNVGQVGALTIDSGTYNAGGGFNFGSGTGVLTMNGGTVNAGGLSYWGTEANADFNATINSGATVNFNGIDGYTSLRMMNGTGIAGIVNIDGGTFAVNGGDLELGLGNSDATSQTTINISNGGVLSVGNATERWTIIGSAGTGKATINVNEGGKLSFWRIAHTSTGECELNVDGGTLEILGKTWNYDSGTFAADNDASFTVTIGEHGATLNTNGFDVKIPKIFKGAGTLTITGGGSVLFTAQPECTIVANGATYTIEDDKFYWTGNGDGVSWSDSGNWSKSAAPGASDDVVFNKAATVTIANTTVNSVAVNAAVAFNGGATLILGSGGMSGTGTLTLAGANLRSATTTTASVNIVLADGSTNKFIVGADGANFTISGKVSSQEFGTSVLEITQGTGRNNANAGVKLTGDWSDFAGSIVYYQSWGSSNGVRTYQQRALDTFTKSATSANARWDVYATTYDIDLMRADGHFFAESGTADAPAVYKFGSLKMRLPNNKNDTGYSSYVMLEVGNLDEDSSLLYSWRGARNCGVRWIAPTATFGSYAANTAYVDIVGGGNVEFSASGVPTSINFKEKGGYVVLTNDDTLNAAIIAAITTVDLDEDGVVGFYYDGDAELSIDVSSKSTLLSGKTIGKKGSGTLYITGVSTVTAGDVVVNAGSLVLPHGSVVGDVTVAQGTSLVIDLIGAEDNEVVFAYDTVSGNATYRNKASIGEIVMDDTAKTWTYKVTGSSRIFTWIGNDGGSWNDANNWLADGQTTTDIPTAIDTVQFSESANISASGTIAGDVQIATGVTLTIPAGLTFSKLTAASGAAIAFNSDPIATVGGTLTLITVGVASGVDAALDLPPNYGVSVDAGTGAITATRNAATYAWTGAKDNYWGTWGNWSIESSFVKEVPANGDSVVFPANDAAGFEFWTVILSQAANVVSIDIAGDTKLSGSITCSSFTGAGKIILDGATITQNGGSITIANNLEVLENTSNYISLDRVSCTLNGNLSGSGNLTIWKSTSGGADQGMKFYGNNSAFSGTFTSTQAYARNGIYFDSKDAVSEDAVWYFDNTSPKENTQTYVFNGTGTYSFGAFVGRLKSGDAKRSVCFGKRSDVDTNVTLSNRHTSNGSRQGGFDVVKVGSGYANIRTTTENGTPSTDAIESLDIQGGTVHLETGLPMTSLGFTEYGGMLQVGYTTASQEIVDVPAETDSETGEVITPAQTHMEYTYTPYDPSSLIKNSTAPIGFDDLGTNSTWATALAESNVGGLIKDGAGTLTLSAEPLYLGPTWVKAGKIVFPNGTDVTLDPRTVGTAENADVQGYKYMDNTVLYGNEPGSDVTMNVDVSTITKVDISAPAFAEALVDDGYVVLCATTGNITGLVSRKFVMGETLLVPEKPEDVPAKKWNWMVRIMRVNGKNCLCVGPKILPYTITLR